MFAVGVVVETTQLPPMLLEKAVDSNMKKHDEKKMVAGQIGR
jgi:hypothetical protein